MRCADASLHIRQTSRARACKPSLNVFLYVCCSGERWMSAGRQGDSIAEF